MDEQLHDVPVAIAVGEPFLAASVARYFHEGFAQGDTLIAIASDEHRTAILAELTALRDDTQRLEREERLIFLDVHGILAQLLVDGEPDRGRFEKTIGAIVRDAASRTGTPRVRLYGELVNVLMRAGSLSAAVHLEQLWNALLKSTDSKLFCVYPT